MRCQQMDTKYLILDFADLGSSNERDLDRANHVLLSAVARAGQHNLDVEVNAKRVGASFVGIVVRADALARSKGGQVRLQAVAPHVRTVLKLCRFDHLVFSTA